MSQAPTLIFSIILLISGINQINSACSIFIQSENIKYLEPSQLLQYNITDPCTTTCKDGYYGDFCQDLSKYSSLPMGPWNQAGYYTAGGILRSMTIDVSTINSIQYTQKDSVLVGISNGGRISSIIHEISLYARTVTPILLPTPSGTLDAVLVRKKVVYVARTVQVLSTRTYELAVISAPLQAQKLMAITTQAVLIEVCADKGTLTAFVYGESKVNACYPNGVCTTWALISTISGMIGGADCKNTLYASSYGDLIKITSAGPTMLKSTGTTIYCLTGLPELNVLLYKSKNNMWQVNLGTGAVSSLPLGVTQTQEVVCSTDVSEQSNQILIVQNGVISTLEAVQEPCAFGQTSPALLSNSTAQCTACPPPPSNSYHIEGSVDCGWACLQGFWLLGSKCVAPVVPPCPANYKAGVGGCVPSVLPWADQGRYVITAGYSNPLSFPVVTPVYLLTSDGSTLIHAIPGQFRVSRNEGGSWTALTFAPYADTNCPYSAQNSYYYLSSRQGVLWVAFTTQRSEGTQHCLWQVNRLESTQLKVNQSWPLSSQLCSATGEGGAVYAILCGHNYVSYAEPSTPLSPIIGNPVTGYIDGVFQAARLSGPSSLVAYDSRLYIADTGNCVIREVDLVRSVIGTVSGLHGTCQRADGVLATLVYPTSLVYTPYPGFFLFADKYTTEQNAVIRQFHAPTSTVSTVRAMPLTYFTGLAASYTSIFVLAQRTYHIYNATWAYCQAGTTSHIGSALDASGCVACPAFQYSDKATGSCRQCSTPTCVLPGQLLIPCQLDADSYCGQCTNKPVTNTKYTGPSSTGDCEWAYTPPCPIGYYNSTNLCSSCPKWSTSSAGSKSILACSCMGGGNWIYDGGVRSCVIPSPFIPPAICHPVSDCQAYTEPITLFPVLPSCTPFDADSHTGVCPCQPGEYIQQIYPKVCTACPAGLYSPSGRGCKVCPYLTEPSIDRATCRCAAGTSDVALTQTEPQCACGPGKAFYSTMGCIQCPENTYNPLIQSYSTYTTTPMHCIQCPDGMISQAGAAQCETCPLGQFRLAPVPACQSCPAGAYAPDPAASTCVECSADCGGGREARCPTNSDLFMCSDCPEPRTNSAFNGGRDCATSCNTGFYELDGECVLCTEYYKTTCPEGSRLVECSSYADAGCIGCVNTSMPLNFAVWSYVPALGGRQNGPSSACGWECEMGYAPARPQLPEGVEAAWECVKAGEWSVWDLFTL